MTKVYHIYSNKRCPQKSAAYGTKKFISVTVPIQRLLKEVCIPKKTLYQATSKQLELVDLTDQEGESEMEVE